MEYWLTWVNECLPEYIGFSLDKEKQIEMAKDLYNSASCINDMGFEMRGGRSSAPEIDYKNLYESEKAKNETLEKENSVYLNSVCRRHKVDQRQVRVEYDSVISLKITSIAEERKLITNDGKSIIEYVINGTKIVSLNGNVVEKSFNSVCIENSYELRSAVRNPDDVCALCRNGIEETRKCYVGGWDKCNGMKFKTA